MAGKMGLGNASHSSVAAPFESRRVILLSASPRTGSGCGFTFEVQRSEGFGWSKEAEAFSGRVVVVFDDDVDGFGRQVVEVGFSGEVSASPADGVFDAALQIGSASCRARVCQYVSISLVAVSLQYKQTQYTMDRL